MAKGIRVNQLAKELGVESKAILHKLHEEEIPNVPNHMSLLSVGLAETVRDWVATGAIRVSAGGATATAVEEPPSRGKGARGKKRASSDAESGDAGSNAGGDGHADGHADGNADGHSDGHLEVHGDSRAEGQEEGLHDSAVDWTSEAYAGDELGGGGVGEAPVDTGVVDEASIDTTGDVVDTALDVVAAEGDVEVSTPADGDATLTADGDSADSAEAEIKREAPAHPVTSGPRSISKSGQLTPVVRPTVTLGKVPPKPVASVPFQPKPAALSGPKVIAKPTEVARFGQKVARPIGPGKVVPTKAVVSRPSIVNTPAFVAPPQAPPTPVAPVMPLAPAANAGMTAGGSAPAVGHGAGGGAAGHAANRPIERNRLAADGSVLRQEQRPTVSLNNPVARPAARTGVPAPKFVPAPAQVKGPNVVRIEKPEPVAAPRPRGPLQREGGPTTGFSTARPGVGRGVKVGTDEEEEAKKKAANNRGSLSARRRGLDGRRGEAAERLKEFTDADLIARQDMLNAAAATRAGMESHLKKSENRGTHVTAKTAVQRGGVVIVEEPISVKTLSAALGIKSNDLIFKLMKKKVMATINQTLTVDQAMELALDYGLELEVAQEESAEDRLISEYDEALAESELLESRPTVVTILGHVDHGKTSLLDKIRTANVAAGESGGITQHIAAWTVSVGAEGAKKRVTFIDTPGHQAFTSMRARGANMTDVVVLVVSAAEGVQPQTIESINHAKAADVPIVVAMNKIDRADANPDMVLGQLAANGLNPVEWGGDVEVIRTSAVSGKGIPELIEILDYQSQLLDLKADPTMPPRGTVIEARRDEGLGAVATVLVQEGTLSVGDYVLCGPGYGRVRSIVNDLGVMVKEALPSTPVIVSGLSDVPSPGDILIGVADLEEAKQIATDRAMRSRQKTLAGLHQRTSSSNLIATIKAGEVQTINLIIKADTQGSIETLVKTVTDSNTEEVKVRVIHSGVGAVTESDVELAMATKGKKTDNRVAIIGFHVVPDEIARALAEQNHIDVKTYRVIYEIFDDLKKALSGMLTPEEREKYHGRVEVRQVFKVSRVGNIAGCMVTDGHIQRGSKIRLIRNSVVIMEDLSIETLKRVKDDVKEVKQGFECGIKIAGYDDIKIGDIFEGYIKETFERTL